MLKMNLIFLMTSIFYSGNLLAMDFSGCHVAEIVIAGDINAHVRLDCPISNVPTCATSNTYFSFNKSTDSGNQYLSLVMTAFAANVKVSGFISHDENSCPAWQNNVALLNHLRVTR